MKPPNAMPAVEVDGVGRLGRLQIEIVEAGGAEIFLHLRQAGLEAVVEAGELAAGGGAALRHLGEIGQRVHRAVEREELLVVLLHLGVAGGARR